LARLLATAAGAGELPKPIRIDAAHREAGGEQGQDTRKQGCQRAAGRTDRPGSMHYTLPVQE
jgi:hypothetical protein